MKGHPTPIREQPVSVNVVRATLPRKPHHAPPGSTQLDLPPEHFKLSSLGMGLVPPRDQRQLRQLRSIQISAFEKTIFDVAYICTHDNDFPPRASWLLTILEDLQWLSFVFSQELFEDVPFWIAAVTEPVRLLTNYEGFSIANVIALILVFTSALMIMGVSYLMHKEAKVPIWTLRLLRWLATLILTVFSIPIVTFFIGGVDCLGRLAHYGVSCSTIPQLPLTVLDALGLVLYIPLLVVGSLVFIETSPTSTNPLAKAHGRVECAAVTFRILFVILQQVLLPMGNAATWCYLVLVSAGFAYLFWLKSSSLPYFDVRTNMLRSGMCLAAGFSAAAAMILKAAISPSSNDAGMHGWWPMLIGAAALGLVTGAWVTRWKTGHYLSTTVRVWHRIRRAEEAEARKAVAADQISLDGGKGGLSSTSSLPLSGGDQTKIAQPPSLAYKARPPVTTTTLGSAPATLPSQANASPPSPPAPSTLGLRSGSIAQQGRVAGGRPATSPSGHAAFLNTSALLRKDEGEFVLTNLLRGGSLEALEAAQEHQARRQSSVFESPLHVEVCIRFIRGNPTTKQVAIGLQLLERGLCEFPKDALLLLLAATYLSAYYGDEGASAADILMRELGATRGGVPLDVKFLSFSRDRALRDRGEHVLDRAAIESMEREVRVHHLRALYIVRDVWELVRTTASPNRIAESVTRLAIHMAGASTCYGRLLERTPRDKQLLRAYSQYLAFVEADTTRAAQVLEVAEDVEIQELRAHRESLGLTHLSATGPDDGVDSPPPELATGDDDHGSVADPVTAVERGGEPLSPPPGAVESPRGDASLARKSLTIKTQADELADTRRILWKHGSSVALTNANTAAPPGPQDLASLASEFDLARPAPGPMSRGGSQTSGTSTSKTQRQRASMRRLLEDRLKRPLDHPHTMLALSVLFLATVSVGFAVCLRLFSATITVLNVQFSTARVARKLLSSVVESVRSLVFYNDGNDFRNFQAAIENLKVSLKLLTTQHLPILADSWNSLQTTPPIFRIYKVQYGSNSTDYAPFNYNALQVAQSIVQAGQAAMLLPGYGQLTSIAANQKPAIRFLTDNLDTIYQAIRTLPQTGIDTYQNTVASNMTILLGSLFCAILFLVAAWMFASRWMVGRYFEGEAQILTMVSKVPKKVASGLVLNLEEEIESFKEIIDAENDLGATMDQKFLPNSIERVGPAAPRSKQYYMQMAFGFVVCVLVVIVMFTQTLVSLNLSQGFDRMLNNEDRRHFMVLIRIYSRQWLSPDDTVGDDYSIRATRGALMDSQMYHALLSNDPGGLSYQFPELTVQPRDCASDPLSCPGVVEIPDLGYNYAIASQPMNAEISQFFDMATLVCNYMATSSDGVFDPVAEATFDLTDVISSDIDHRVNDLAVAIMNKFVGNIRGSTATVVTTFVATLIVFVWCIAMLFGVILRRLSNEAHTTATLLYMIPQAAHKDIPGLAPFLDSGGALIRTHIPEDQ